MTTPFNSEQKFNELIFENRNKEYGAFAIRDSYGNTVTKSMFITLSGIALMIFVFAWFGKGIEKLPDLGTNLLVEAPILPGVEIEIQKPKEEKVQPRKVVSPPKTVNGNFTASDTENNKIEINENTIISKIAGDGIDSVQETGPVEPKVIPPPVENSDPKVWVDKMPEFNGNLYQFIKDNLKYPQIAVENGTGGTVVLSFIVEKDGSIEEINVLNNIPDGCTQEAIRVVKLMPRWKPGINHGMPTRVVLNLPVKFRLQ